MIASQKRLEEVTDRKKGFDLMKEFDETKIGGEFWDTFHEIIDSTDSIVFLLKLKHRVDEYIEDQTMYVLANAVE